MSLWPASFCTTWTGSTCALRKQNYHVIDADQWGQSYRHSQDRRLSAELDELEQRDAYVKLLLRSGDLDQADIGTAEECLSLHYERIYQLCLDRSDEYDYDLLTGLGRIEDGPECIFDDPDIQKYDLTYAFN